MRNETEFKKELENLINKYSMENGSNTPDFIIAEYLVGCLRTFNNAYVARTNWYGSSCIEGEGRPLEIGTEAGWADPTENCTAPDCCCNGATGCEKEMD